MILLRKRTIGYTVLVDNQPTGLALTNGMADIVAEERGSLKGTRLSFDTVATVFPTRKAARRAIERTKIAVAKQSNNFWADSSYEVMPLVALRPISFRRAA